MGRDVRLGCGYQVAERRWTGDDSRAREPLQVEQPVDRSGGGEPGGSRSDLDDDVAAVSEPHSDDIGEVPRPEDLDRRRRAKMRQAPAREHVVHEPIVASPGAPSARQTLACPRLGRVC